MNPLKVALRGKGLSNLVRRIVNIGQTYGLTPVKMEQTLTLLTETLHRFDCCGTFPVVAAVLVRRPHLFRQYQAQGLEFAIHGYRHIDYAQLPSAEQTTHLQQAKQLFDRANIQANGFRGPYLHANSNTLAAVASQQLAYDSSDSLAWDVLTEPETPGYRHVLKFYGTRSATDYPALPRREAGLVRLPYSLPDDEALANRLALTNNAQMSAIWQAILQRSYDLGELFIVGLHPERTRLCLEALTALLSEARRAEPPVWIARLDEIAHWWTALSQITFKVQAIDTDLYHLTIDGPPELTVLSKQVSIQTQTTPWSADFEHVLTTNFRFKAKKLPCIAASPAASTAMTEFLRQQGFWVETSEHRQLYATYLNQTKFTPEDERPLLAQLAKNNAPLIRVGRWPNGAKSAVSITGDIDAMTLWDYILRFLGR